MSNTVSRISSKSATHPFSVTPGKRRSYLLRSADFHLLFKKIGVGIIIAAVPLVIILGGLLLTKHLLQQPKHVIYTNPLQNR